MKVWTPKTGKISTNSISHLTTGHEIIILFDGYCVLCSGLARWLHHHLGTKITLQALQSSRGRTLLRARGIPPEKSDEVVVLLPETVKMGPEALLFVLSMAGGGWSCLARLLNLAPRKLVSWGYRLIARHRYRWFGKRKSCTVL